MYNTENENYDDIDLSEERELTQEEREDFDEFLDQTQYGVEDIPEEAWEEWHNSNGKKSLLECVEDRDSFNEGFGYKPKSRDERVKKKYEDPFDAGFYEDSEGYQEEVKKKYEDPFDEGFDEGFED